MTFKELQKLVQSQSGPEQSQLLQRLRDKPFWYWDPKQHKQEDIKTKGDYCFNHITGLPTKDGWTVAGGGVVQLGGVPVCPAGHWFGVGVDTLSSKKV